MSGGSWGLAVAPGSRLLVDGHRPPPHPSWCPLLTPRGYQGRGEKPWTLCPLPPPVIPVALRYRSHPLSLVVEIQLLHLPEVTWGSHLVLLGVLLYLKKWEQQRREYPMIPYTCRDFAVHTAPPIPFSHWVLPIRGIMSSLVWMRKQVRRS
uniref:Uncharacterized protein n=1 Tax=Myotis myotis TaxID=51298 RepID=A0A7J7VZ50_MYOMY|nr:hypothetical protein mMyoMyo1_012297 [Myotis myotis]